MVTSERLGLAFVILTVFTIPLAGIYIPTGFFSLSITNVLLIMTAGVVISNQISNRYISLSRLQYTVIIIFVIVLFFGAASTYIHQGSPRRFVTVAGYLLLFAITTLTLNNYARVKIILHVMFLSAIMISMLSILSSVAGISFGARLIDSREIAGFSFPSLRTTGIPLSYGEFGMFILSTLPFYTIHGIRKKHRGYLIGSGTIIFAVLFTLQSRSTWLALLAALTVVLIFDPISRNSFSRTSVRKYLRVALFLVLPIVSFAVVWAIIEIGGSIGVRRSQIITSLQLIIENPLFGVGWGNLKPLYEKGFRPHNAFLRHGVEGGIVPLILLSGLMIILLRNLISILFSSSSEAYRLSVGLVAGSTAVLVEANFLVGLGKTGWLWVAVIVSFERIYQPTL